MLWIGETRRKEMLARIQLFDIMQYDSFKYGVYQLEAKGDDTGADRVVTDPETLRAPSSPRSPQPGM